MACDDDISAPFVLHDYAVEKFLNQNMRQKVCSVIYCSNFFLLLFNYLPYGFPFFYTFFLSLFLLNGLFVIICLKFVLRLLGLSRSLQRLSMLYSEMISALRFIPQRRIWKIPGMGTQCCSCVIQMLFLMTSLKKFALFKLLNFVLFLTFRD